MSEIKLPAASGGGSSSIKGPASSGSDVDVLDTSGNLTVSGDIDLADNKKVMEHLSIDDIDSLFDYKLQLGLCPQFVDQIIKLTHTSRESDQQYFERYLSK